MRCDRLRRVLVVVVAGLLFLPAALFSQQQNPIPARSVRLSLVIGKVTVKSPGAAQGVQAQVNVPIEEGFVVLTSAGSSANVALENGSTIRLFSHAKARFTQLSTDADGNKLNGITLEKGLAGFAFAPERQDVFKVMIADATLTSHGKANFLTTVSPGTVHLHVLAGSVTISAHADSMTVGKGKALVYNPLTAVAGAKSHARVVRLSFVSGTVMVKRPGSAEAEPAMVNTPIQEGFELSTSAAGYAEVEFENGSTARLGELSKLLFHSLALDANGDKLNGMTFEQGYATFHLLPEHNAASSPKRDGNIHFQPPHSDVYMVKIADATVSPDGKCEFRTDLDQDSFRVEVFHGSVDVATSSLSTKLGEGKVLEHKSGGTESAFNTRRGITPDAWDQWTEARDKQTELAIRDRSVPPAGLLYGWSDLNTYGEWIGFPNGTAGWSPYAPAGWSPYTNGQWGWYPGLGWTWVSGEPWGWLPYHCGQWDFDASFGWYWMDPMYGCGFWDAALVTWYAGPGWIGWAPQGGGGPPGGPPHPRPVPPGVHPGPGPAPRPGPRPFLLARGLVTVPTSVVQNRQMITPEIVSHTPATAGDTIARPPFELSSQPPNAASSAAAPTVSNSRSNAAAATAMPASAPVSGPGAGFAHRGSAPSTILMGGDVAKESALLSDSHFRSGREPLRAAQGTTLGGRLPVQGAIGEFRGNAYGGTGKHGESGGVRGPGGAPIISRSYGGGSGAVLMSHGGGGGGSRGGYSGGGRSGGGGYSGGGGGGGYSGGGASSGGGHSGGGGGGSVATGGGHH